MFCWAFSSLRTNNSSQTIWISIKMIIITCTLYCCNNNTIGGCLPAGQLCCMTHQGLSNEKPISCPASLRGILSP